jgi:two-component system, OmpR family, response regulator
VPGRPLKRILLVEDDPDIQTITSLALGTFGGYEVRVCGSAADAIEGAAAFAPDLLLMDVMMPGIDGIETLRALRQIPETADTPVVFLTARVQPSDVARYQELGSLGLIRKPFEPMALVETIGQIWSRHTARSAQSRRRLQELQRAYRADLPQKIRLIADDAAALRAGVWEPGRLQALHDQIHRLAGSAAVYGLDEVSRAAAALELWTMAALASGDLENRPDDLDALLGALDRACRTGAGSDSRRAAKPPKG